MNLREQRMVQNADNALKEVEIEFILSETRSALADWDGGEVRLAQVLNRIAAVGVLARHVMTRDGDWRHWQRKGTA